MAYTEELPLVSNHLSLVLAMFRQLFQPRNERLTFNERVSEYQSVITKLLDNLKSNDMSCSVRLFALLTLGGIGKHRYNLNSNILIFNFILMYRAID